MRILSFTLGGSRRPGSDRPDAHVAIPRALPHSGGSHRGREGRARVCCRIHVALGQGQRRRARSRPPPSVQADPSRRAATRCGALSHCNCVLRRALRRDVPGVANRAERVVGRRDLSARAHHGEHIPKVRSAAERRPAVARARSSSTDDNLAQSVIANSSATSNGSARMPRTSSASIADSTARNSRLRGQIRTRLAPPRPDEWNPRPDQ